MARSQLDPDSVIRDSDLAEVKTALQQTVTLAHNESETSFTDLTSEERYGETAHWLQSGSVIGTEFFVDPNMPLQYTYIARGATPCICAAFDADAVRRLRVEAAKSEAEASFVQAKKVHV